MSVRRGLVLVPLLLVLASPAVAAPAKPPPKPTPGSKQKPKPVTEVGIRLDPFAITYGQAASVSGQLTGHALRQPLVLQGAPFPVQAFADVARGASGADGRYSFAVAPPITMRYQVSSATDRSVASGIVHLAVSQRVDAAVSDSTRDAVSWCGSRAPSVPGTPARSPTCSAGCRSAAASAPSSARTFSTPV
jgi:hypothetical protein